MKSLLIFFLCLSFSFGFSQDIDVAVKKSEIFKDKKKRTNLSFVEEDGNGGLLSIRTFTAGFIPKPKGYYIEHFDNNLNLLKSTELEIKRNEIRGVLIEDGIVNLIEFNYNKPEKSYQFNILSAPLSSLDFKRRELFTLGEKEIKKYFAFAIGIFFIDNGMSQMDNNAFGEVAFSSNKEFIAFNFDIKNKDKETHRVFVYNKNFEKVYEKQIEKNIKDKYFEYENIDVDDTDGSVYFLGKVFENKSRKSKKKGKANYHYELFKVNKDEQQHVSFKTDDHFVGSLSTIKGEDKLSCVGFYSDKNDWRYKGVCRFDIDPNSLSIEKKSFLKFSDQFMIDKYGKKKDKELRNLSFRGVFMLDNGDITLNAEEFYITTHTSYSQNGGMRTYYIYHYDDIISTRISANGDLVWARNINKRQRGTTFSSYTATLKNDEVYFFINCSDKIKKLRNDRIQFKQTKAKKSNLYAIVIDKNGDFNYKNVVDDKDSEVAFYVRNGVLSNNGRDVIFTGRKGKKKQLIKLSI